MPFTSRAYRDYANGSTGSTGTPEITLGYHPETRDEFLVRQTDRYAGTYVIGVQGMGKSGLLETMIAQDARVGNAVMVIDPHGDLADHCIAQLPAEAVSRTYVLDMLDEDYPFGVNIFAGGLSRSSVENSQKISRVGGVFEAVWGDVLSQAYLPRYLRAALIVLLASSATLVDMKRFLLDDTIRARLLANLKDHDDVKHFWETEYTQLTTAERMQRVQPLVGRLETLFLGRPLMRNIMGQRKTTISFREEIAKRSILFIKLPVKTLEMDARLLGTILVAQIHSAVFSFADLPEAQRPGVSLYVDEFQHFATPDFSELFTEGRKFGARVTIAHQYRNQLPSYLQDSTKTARTKVCFHIMPDDAREMAHFFPAQTSTVLPEDIDPHATRSLLDYTPDAPYVKEFVEVYLRPMLVFKRGNKVDIQHRQWSWSVWNGTERKNFYVVDPTPYLDNLLFNVMRTGNAQLEIPLDAATGFANGGRGFFTEVRHSWNNSLLQGNVSFPPHLVVQSASGPRWTRRPESAKEQYYHFVFCLRMTMRYLAEQPIGKVTQSSAADVARMLTQLPPRAAFVRSNEDIGVIYTHDVPVQVSGQELAERVAAIRDQTRTTFCHPREDVERLLNHHEASLPDEIVDEVVDQDSVPTQVVRRPTLPRSRWEDVK